MSDENQNQLPINFPLDATPSINELCEALSLAQGEFPVIPKNSKVEVKNKEGRFLYSYLYADLTEIISCTRGALTKHGLSFTQDYMRHRFLGSGIVTILFHKSGQYMRAGFVPCDVKSADMKKVAGDFTYGKRISLTAALGISADEDIDAGSIEGDSGNTTSKSQNKPPVKNHAPQSAPPPESDWPPMEDDPFGEPKPSIPQIKRLFAIATSMHWSNDDIKQILKSKYNIESTKDLSLDQYNELVEIVQSQIP